MSVSTAGPSSCDTSTSASPPNSPEAVSKESPDLIFEHSIIEINDSHCLEVGSELGSGSFGKVFSVLHVNLDQEFALKVVKDADGKKKKGADREVAMMKRLMYADAWRDHIVRCHSIFYYGSYMCMVLEKLDIDLFNLICQRQFRPFRLDEVQNLGGQLAIALARLHSLGIVHTDIKTENIMISNIDAERPIVKLVDFGLAMVFEDLASRRWSSLQTVCYRAPEVVYGRTLTQAIDLWSLGCMLVELYLGSTLYPADNNYNLIKMWMKTQGIPSYAETGYYSHRYLDRVKSIDARGQFKSKLQLRSEEACRQDGYDVKQETNQNYPLRSLDRMLLFGYNNIMCETITQQDKLLLNIVEGLMDLEPERRPSAEQVLKMPFFKHSIEQPPVTRR